jgi:hypothetical protein
MVASDVARNRASLIFDGHRREIDHERRNAK